MRGDRVLVIVDTGAGLSREFEIAATQNGRKVVVTPAGPKTRGMLEVAEVTRTGREVRVSRFTHDRVIACVESPVGGPGEDEEAQTPARARRREAGGQIPLDMSDQSIEGATVLAE